MGKVNHLSGAIEVTWISIGVNVLLSGVKFTAGFLSGSISIIADAAHSLSDCLTSVVLLVSFYLSSKPADKEHPFGHGRMEDIGGFILSALLALAGVLFLRESIVRFFKPQQVIITNSLIVIIGLTAVIKLLLGKFTQNRARNIDSSALLADAVHHYSDFLSSIAVAVGMIFIQRGFLFADSVLGCGVSIFIIYLGVVLLRNTGSVLLGRAAGPKVYAEIKEIVLSFPEVKGIHDIHIHSYGRDKVVSLHAEMKRDLSLEVAHSVASSIETKISQAGLGGCLVHMDLARQTRRFEPSDIERFMRNLKKKSRLIKDFHDLNIVSLEDQQILSVHLLLDKKVSIEASHLMSHKVEDKLKKRFGFTQVNIHIEPHGK